MKISRVKNHEKIIQSNDIPDQGLDFGLECQELKKGINDMIKIYLDPFITSQC